MRNSVLFVDDEINILRALKRLFMDQDIDIVTAESSSEAMNILKSTGISVVVSDNLMPGMKGIDFLEKVKDISPDSMKIMMTAHADLGVAMEAINRGEVYKFVTKPRDDEELKNSNRPYLSEVPPKRAIQFIVDSKGHQFDPLAASRCSDSIFIRGVPWNR
jgi:DNA-binding NtrC family response regulator